MSPTTYARLDEIRRREALAAAACLRRGAEAAPAAPRPRAAAGRPHTVQTLVTSLLARLGVATRSEAASRAVRDGLI